MQLYQNRGYTIEFDLPVTCGFKNYSVECIYRYDKKEKKYALSMWLKRRDIPNKHAIISQGIDTQFISGTRETIKRNICLIIKQALISGFFSRYIQDFEYIYECFDKGNALFERQRIEAANHSPNSEKRRNLYVKTIHID